MLCSSCSRDNPEDASFCAGCGERLAAECRGCGRSNAPDSAFCNGCGRPLDEPAASPPLSEVPTPRSYTPRHLADKILTTKSAIEGERKRVTVLFVDLQRSMELSEGIDPEEWHKLMDRFFSILADGVHRYEGTVNQYTGDGIMALFGAPIAHEDHAQRACWSTLELRDALREYGQQLKRERGLTFTVRMGIHTGDVVVGKIGDDLRMDYTAQGHTVGLAARMQQLASPDTIYLTRDVASLVQGYFKLNELGNFRVKGVSEEVEAFELIGAGAMRTRLDVSAARGFSKFVGRAAEMDLLEHAQKNAESGHGQVIGIVADAGTGKSRLCFEFLERCRARGLTIYEARGVAHGKGIPFIPILELFRSFFGVSERDADESAREKIAGRLLLLDEDFREALPMVFDFLGVPDPENPAPKMDPDAWRRQWYALVKRVVQARSEKERAVTLIEDLHWIDEASEGFIRTLVEAAPLSRNLTILNFRPEYSADWMRHSFYQQVPLVPLGADAIRELLVDLLGDDPSLAGLPERIHEHTAGNPFFIEEVAQTLVENGSLEGERGAYRLATPIEKLSVPPTVQSVLAARIDRLAEREKHVLQTGSVIGKDFGRGLLDSVADLPVAELDEAQRTLIESEFV
ncbi:MAG: adenylate/guanylate cyclase domain-containing protein, partial [Myxococcota bacterium]